MAILRKTPRPFPYIIGIGNKFNIIVDGKPLVSLQDRIADALLCLVAVYYVFGISWCPDIEPNFLFIQKKMLGIADERTDKNKEVAIFCSLMV